MTLVHQVNHLMRVKCFRWVGCVKRSYPVSEAAPSELGNRSFSPQCDTLKLILPFLGVIALDAHKCDRMSFHQHWQMQLHFYYTMQPPLRLLAINTETAKKFCYYFK